MNEIPEQRSDLISPTSDRPGVIPVYLSRGDLVRLIECLKDSTGDVRVCRNIFIRDLELVIMADLDAIEEAGGHPRAQEYVDLLKYLEAERGSSR